MVNAVASRLGQINSAGDELALMLKVFGGEVLTTFPKNTIMRPFQMLRTIPSGKSAQFPVLGQTGAYYHVPGDEILGEQINGAERNIDIEGMLIAPVFIANIDELFSHFDARQPYAMELSRALGRQYDSNVARTGLNAARITTPTVANTQLGDTLTSTNMNAGFATDGAILFAGVYDAGVTLDQRGVPTEDRNAFMDPVRYALLVKDGKAIDWRYNEGNSGRNGGYDTGRVGFINDIAVRKTNNYPSSNDIGAAIQPTVRQHDYSTSRALIMHKSAIGTVALQDVTTEAAYDIRRQGHLMVAKYVCGHGVLRPESAYELQSANPAG